LDIQTDLNNARSREVTAVTTYWQASAEVHRAPGPRVNLTRFHGVFAPNSMYRAKVTPVRRGKRKNTQSPEGTDQTTTQRRASIAWAQWLKRVFKIDIA